MQEFLLVSPTVEPVTLTLAKQYIRVTHSLEDDLISSMISSARKLCEDTVNIAISPQRWKATFRIPEYRNDEFGLSPSFYDPERIGETCALPRPPVSAINSISSSGPRGITYPFVAGTHYSFDATTGLITWLTPRYLRLGTDDGWYARPTTLTVDYNCGFPLAPAVNPGSTQSDALSPAVIVPPNVREAVLITLASLYENRGDDNTTFPKKALLALKPYWNNTRGAG